MASSSIVLRIYSQLVNILPASTRLGCLASNISFVLKSRHASVMNPEDIEVIVFTDYEASTERGQCRFIFIVRHYRLEGCMRVELYGWGTPAHSGMLFVTLESTVQDEMMKILQRLEGVINGSRIPYVSFDQRIATPNNSNGSDSGQMGVLFDNSWIHEPRDEESGGNQTRVFEHNVQGEQAGVSSSSTAQGKRPFYSMSPASYPAYQVNE